MIALVATIVTALFAVVKSTAYVAKKAIVGKTAAVIVAPVIAAPVIAAPVIAARVMAEY